MVGPSSLSFAMIWRRSPLNPLRRARESPLPQKRLLGEQRLSEH
jgi:hypothetical protein